ncbi:MAG: aldehyde dehydrogenase EutE [Bryobacteraceae bacterium]|nr:aldehyde dehydrogenase EutE [Bryobacteraceae bacterium]
MTGNREQLIAEIAREVVARLQGQAQGGAPVQASAATGDGVFATVDEAVKAAAEAQKRIAALSLDERGRIVGIIKRMCAENASEWGRIELEETGLGRLDHKIEKLKNVRNAVGVEALQTSARSDTTGLLVIERAPWGVIGMVLPATHSVPTMATNAINVIAAGNTAIFSPHPAGAKVAALALRAFNHEIERQLGIANAITTVANASIRSAEEIFHHPGIALITVTGGPSVVRAASKSGKRVIAAGPGNPPVVVDETADLDNAAKSIVTGASFDNNLLCIAEKEVFVVAPVFDAFISAMKRAGAYELNVAAIDRLTQAAFTFDTDAKGCGRAHLKKDLIGKDVSVLAAAAGVQVPAGTDLLFGQTSEDHAFVQEEQMMPFVPIVRVPDVDAGIAASVKAEHNYRHTALIHSRNMHNVTKMAKAMNTTLFVANAPCAAALGADAPSYMSFSIATPTGEGVTTPLTFTRERQVVVGGGDLRFI